VSRRIFQCIAGLIFIFAALTPLVNCFDTWDRNQPPVNDTELRVTVLFVVAAFVQALPRLVRKFLILAINLRWISRLLPSTVALSCSDWVSPEPTASPPLIPLRI
jgi:hypothetical protein